MADLVCDDERKRFVSRLQAGVPTESHVATRGSSDKKKRVPVRLRRKSHEQRLINTRYISNPHAKVHLTKVPAQMGVSREGTLGAFSVARGETRNRFIWHGCFCLVDGAAGRNQDSWAPFSVVGNTRRVRPAWTRSVATDTALITSTSRKRTA